MRWYIKYVVVALPLMAVTAGLALLIPKMAPVQEGTSAEFWKLACGVDIGPEEVEFMGGTYRPRDDWFIYYAQGFHGQFLYRVRRSAVMADFPRALEALRAPKPEAVRSDVVTGYEAWVKQGGDPRQDVAGLLDNIRQARLARLREKHPDSYEYALARDEEFEERWKYVRRYWVNVLFESFFFAGFIVFAAWPWLRDGSRASWSVHTGLLPLLLFLPCFLGYASFTFTSAGPSGGILYPWVIRVIVWYRSFAVWTSWDSWIFRFMPQPLSVISQPLGPMLSLSGGGPGPVAVLVAGLVVGGFTYWVSGFFLAKGSRK